MKLPAAVAPLLSTILMSACMATVMSTTLTVIRSGIVPDLGWRIAESTAIAFPIALVATLVLRSMVRAIVSRVTKPRKRTLISESDNRRTE